MKNETAMIDPDDRDGQTCTKCGIGYYYETSIHDDWDGVLHCNNKKCNHEVKRYKSKDNPPPKPEKVKLSPAAQHFYDSYWGEGYFEAEELPSRLAAALRAVAERNEYKPNMSDEMEVMFSEGWNSHRKELLAIADELEAQ